MKTKNIRIVALVTFLSSIYMASAPALTYSSLINQNPDVNNSGIVLSRWISATKEQAYSSCVFPGGSLELKDFNPDNVYSITYVNAATCENINNGSSFYFNSDTDANLFAISYQQPAPGAEKGVLEIDTDDISTNVPQGYKPALIVRCGKTSLTGKYKPNFKASTNIEDNASCNIIFSNGNPQN